jgi:hypothetical protein
MDGNMGHTPFKESSFDEANEFIHSVKRLSDNTVFSIGDNTLHGKIEEFKPLDDKINHETDIAASLGDTDKWDKNKGKMAVRFEGDRLCWTTIDKIILSTPPTPSDTVSSKTVAEDDLVIESRAFYAGMDGRYKTFSYYKQHQIKQ